MLIGGPLEGVSSERATASDRIGRHVGGRPSRRPIGEMRGAAVALPLETGEAVPLDAVAGAVPHEVVATDLRETDVAIHAALAAGLVVA